MLSSAVAEFKSIPLNFRQNLTHQFNVHSQDSGYLRIGLLLCSQPRDSATFGLI